MPIKYILRALVGVGTLFRHRLCSIFNNVVNNRFPGDPSEISEGARVGPEAGVAISSSNRDESLLPWGRQDLHGRN